MLIALSPDRESPVRSLRASIGESGRVPVSSLGEGSVLECGVLPPVEAPVLVGLGDADFSFLREEPSCVTNVVVLPCASLVITRPARGDRSLGLIKLNQGRNDRRYLPRGIGLGFAQGS